MDILTISIGIAGIIIGVISNAVFSNYSARKSRELAVESGSLKTSKPAIYFMKKNLSVINQDDVTWYIVLPEDATKIVCPLSFIISNYGDKKLDDAIFLIQGAKSYLHDPGQDGIKTKIVPGVLEDSVKRSIVSIGKQNQFSYLLPSLYPETSMLLEDMFVIWPTHNNECESNATSADNVKMRFNAKFSWSFFLNVDLLLSDKPKISHSINIMGLPYGSIEKAIKAVKGERNKNKENRASKRCLFLQFESDKRIEFAEDNIMYFMKDSSSDGFRLEEV